MLEDNLHYFKKSIETQEKNLDNNYMFLDWDDNIEKYKETTIKIKELLTTIKVLKEKNKTDNDLYKDLYRMSLDRLGQKSEFNCFINACDTTMDSLKNDFKTFKKVVNLYLDNRTISDYSPKEWIQALIDKGASRGKGSKGEDKVLRLAVQKGFKHISSWEEFNKEKKVVVKFSKNNFDLKSIQKKLDIKLNFKSQGKMLDIILKHDEKIMFIEAKHLKEGGGTQDKQVHELINIIQTRNSNKNVLVGAFLDGVLSNHILDMSEEYIKNPKKLNYEKNKTVRQQVDIIKALKTNKNNFWFNTAGFKKFIKDF
ncbi:MAG: hypothetical protein HOF38_05015 [Elusimicrobiaceae bacterium]|jgi:hypothetical protein|nr:hypothetical protein [Elusimicrobiaceae bacterium]MBT3955497.1 hypothetical protein [Elusimicrobiaceae bacterium]MBT4008547.1 hypothetical protein [Elusimicrobiaceae bacterium]MBT4402380.1 hypothetical protein [Elusimicrobiaceae bacterium]MBT4440336.1 hypothetical protein [Elusimicrobiaceae bacterium]